MEYKFQYFSEDEKQTIMLENQGKYLITVQNITEGNFLVFSDNPPQISVEEQLRQELDAMKQKQALMQSALDDLILAGMGGGL